MTRKRTTPAWMVEVIQRETVLGRGPTEIRRTLDRQAGAKQLLGETHDPVPSLRTIQYIAREVRPKDDSETWSPATADPDEAALVLPVLVQLVKVGQLTSVTQAMARWVADVTQAMARWVARVRRMAPEMELLDALLFAGRYLAAERSSHGYADVDLALARRLAERPPG